MLPRSQEAETMDLLTLGLVVSSLMAMAVGFTISLQRAREQSDRVTIKIDGEVLEVRQDHAKEDLQRVLARLIPPSARESSAAPGQRPPRHLHH
jgi:hypothetical protein